MERPWAQREGIISERASVGMREGMYRCVRGVVNAFAEGVIVGKTSLRYDVQNSLWCDFWEMRD